MVGLISFDTVPNIYIINEYGNKLYKKPNDN